MSSHNNRLFNSTWSLTCVCFEETLLPENAWVICGDPNYNRSLVMKYIQYDAHFLLDKVSGHSCASQLNGLRTASSAIEWANASGRLCWCRGSLKSCYVAVMLINKLVCYALIILYKYNLWGVTTYTSEFIENVYWVNFNKMVILLSTIWTLPIFAPLKVLKILSKAIVAFRVIPKAFFLRNLWGKGFMNAP